jgi:hypothetical protein
VFCAGVHGCHRGLAASLAPKTPHHKRYSLRRCHRGRNFETPRHSAT